MLEGEVEHTRVPRIPLDVLCQQIVAMASVEELQVDALHALVRRAYPYRELTREQLENVLDLLAGRYPSDEFAELRPRIVWERTTGALRAREGAQRIAIANAGTIPDRGLYGVFLVDGGGRVGELDEEMVHEAREGQVFLLGASAWRIEQITRDRVIVSPAPGQPAQVPFWKGEQAGRPLELGRAVGRLQRELAALDDESARAAPDGRARLRRARRAHARRVPARAGARDRRRCRPTARSSSSASATRSATGACACSRPSARACTRPGALALRRAAARAARHRDARAVVGRRHHPAPARRRRPAAGRAHRDRPRRASRISSSASSAARRCSARASARAPRARC